MGSGCNCAQQVEDEEIEHTNHQRRGGSVVGRKRSLRTAELSPGISAAVNVEQYSVSEDIKVFSDSETLPNPIKLAISHADFEPELYDIWQFHKKTNNVSHPGNTEVTIVDNLLYKYTSPFDIVVDPVGHR